MLQNFIIHTTDILSGQWSDPLYFDFDGIDPSIFFDDDGKAYVQICAHPKGGIWQFQIDIKTAQPLTAPSLLWEGWDRRFTEGPHVYKKDGYYYLLVAEGGTFEEHMISVARSKSIHGPFDPCPNNPLLTAAGTNNYLHHTGHGDLFQDANGYWYTVVLAVRRTGSRFPLGRETFLARVSWPKNEWPRIHEPSICHLAAAQGGSALHFENKNNSLIHLRDADVSKYTVSDGGVVISASAADLASHKDTLSFAGRRQIHLVGTSCVALVTPSVTLASGALKAGISLYKDEHRFAALGYDFGKGQMYFEARNRASGFSVEATMAVPTKDRAYLCIEYTELEWAFQYRIGKCDEWVRLGVVDTGLLSGRDFTGPIIGMFAVGQGEAQNREVRFEEVELHIRIEDGRSRPVQISSLIVPDAALCEELVDLYFRYAHIAFHNLFHRPTFTARVQDSSIPKILFFGVASLSARYSTHAVFAGITPWDRGRPYRDETKRLLDLEDTSLTSIQACMLLAANASVEGDPNTESVYHAIAFRMAILLDLPARPTESMLEQEINRRVWWSLVTTETWTSAAHSLPRLVKPRDTVPLPIDERQFLSLSYNVPVTPIDSDLSAEAGSPSGDTSQSLLAQMIRLNILLYDIILFNARVVAAQAEEGVDETTTHRLAHALDDWAGNLSPQLQYSDESVAFWVGEGLGAMFITAHINYNHAGQLLFYQHLHSAQDLDQGSALAPSNAARNFARRCKQHATNLCDLIHHARQRSETEVLYPLAGHILCLASTVQIHTLLFGFDEDEIQAAKIRLERNFEMISSMNNYWPMNHKSIGRLQLFHNTCLRSKDDSFRLDAWMLRFLLGFTQDIEDRDVEWAQGHGASRGFDHLRNLLDI
ncbi:hypothetical protein ACHAQA_005330 [Verticillium albo-atrum]